MKSTILKAFLIFFVLACFCFWILLTCTQGGAWLDYQTGTRASYIFVAPSLAAILFLLPFVLTTILVPTLLISALIFVFVLGLCLVPFVPIVIFFAGAYFLIAFWDRRRNQPTQSPVHTPSYVHPPEDDSQKSERGS